MLLFPLGHRYRSGHFRSPALSLPNMLTAIINNIFGELFFFVFVFFNRESYIRLEAIIKKLTKENKKNENIADKCC
jgi:hypothetical protein